MAAILGEEYQSSFVLLPIPGLTKNYETFVVNLITGYNRLRLATPTSKIVAYQVVSGLANPDFVVEMDATAFIPE